jgi:hypothetical protein
MSVTALVTIFFHHHQVWLVFKPIYIYIFFFFHRDLQIMTNFDVFVAEFSNKFA